MVTAVVIGIVALALMPIMSRLRQQRPPRILIVACWLGVLFPYAVMAIRAWA